MDPLAGMAEPDFSALQKLLDNMPDVGSLMTGHLNDLLGNAPFTPESDQAYVEDTTPEQTDLDKVFRIICPADISPAVGEALRELIEEYPGVRIA